MMTHPMPPQFRARRLACWCCLLLAMLPVLASGQAQSAFVPRLTAERDGQGVSLTLHFSVAAGAFLYAEAISVTVDQATVTLRQTDKPENKDGDDVYLRDFTQVYHATPVADAFVATVSYQGCLASGLCLLPQNKTFDFQLKPAVVEATPVAEPAAPQQTAPENIFASLSENFRTAGSLAGYAGKEDFIQWLDRVEAGTAAERTDNLLEQVFSSYGLLLAALLLLPLGLLLNFTPCILPMIPVTLAILGAGAKDGRKGKGFALGLAYGLGMALAYGTLGAMVAVSGGQFGALNASPWFNAAVAVLFVILALAMLDIFTLDLTRLRNATTFKPERGRVAGAFLMGGLSAILAGACVAPVLLWVLLLATKLVSSGDYLGLVLPFFLGLGMALPWPFLGAGLSRLPKPGAWMIRIRQFFAAIMLILALYYANVSRLQFNGADASGQYPPGWTADLLAAMSQADAQHRPLLIDCWGTACKNCTLMDENVLPHPDVVKRLESYALVKFKADNTSDPLTKAFLEKHDVKGFPTFIVLVPKN